MAPRDPSRTRAGPSGSLRSRSTCSARCCSTARSFRTSSSAAEARSSSSRAAAPPRRSWQVLGRSMKIGIVGCGLIGRKRAEALGSSAALVACADKDVERARALATKHGARASADWQAVVEATDVELVVVATPHDSLAEITLAAVRQGKHVLVEKPAARSASELEPVVAEAERRSALVRVGFNHRYHRAL